MHPWGKAEPVSGDALEGVGGVVGVVGVLWVLAMLGLGTMLARRCSRARSMRSRSALCFGELGLNCANEPLRKVPLEERAPEP